MLSTIDKIKEKIEIDKKTKEECNFFPFEKKQNIRKIDVCEIFDNKNIKLPMNETIRGLGRIEADCINSIKNPKFKDFVLKMASLTKPKTS